MQMSACLARACKRVHAQVRRLSLAAELAKAAQRSRCPLSCWTAGKGLLRHMQFEMQAHAHGRMHRVGYVLLAWTVHRSGCCAADSRRRRRMQLKIRRIERGLCCWQLAPARAVQ